MVVSKILMSKNDAMVVSNILMTLKWCAISLRLLKLNCNKTKKINWMWCLWGFYQSLADASITSLSNILLLPFLVWARHYTPLHSPSNTLSKLNSHVLTKEEVSYDHYFSISSDPTIIMLQRSLSLLNKDKDTILN